MTTATIPTEATDILNGTEKGDFHALHDAVKATLLANRREDEIAYVDVGIGCAGFISGGHYYLSPLNNVADAQAPFATYPGEWLAIEDIEMESTDVEASCAAMTEAITNAKVEFAALGKDAVRRIDKAIWA